MFFKSFNITSLVWNLTSQPRFNVLTKNNHFNAVCILLNNSNHSSKHYIHSKQVSDIKPVNQLVENEKEDILYKRILLETRSGDKAVLDSYEKFVLMAAKFLDIPISRCWTPFYYVKRRTLLRSAFVKKKYRVQYEIRNYFRSIELKYLTGSTADTFLEYIERNLPEGTALKVYRTRIERLPEHLKPPLEKEVF